jgi:AcrR family transcriptional regulator
MSTPKLSAVASEVRNVIPRQRRERGERRIAAILAAAAGLFAERGFDGTSMAGIAQASDTAIGSLYQFFQSKEAIVDALAEQFIAAWRAHQAAFADDDGRPMRERIDRALDARLAFHEKHRALQTFLEADPARASSVRAVQEEVESVLPLLMKRYPALAPARLRRTVRVVNAMVRGVMPVLVEEPNARARARLLAETKAAIVAVVEARIEEANDG